MTVTDELLVNAERYAGSFDKGDLPLPPAKHIAIVACMDARLNVYGLLGLTEGDAHVIRNAGGIVTQDELRDAILEVQRDADAVVQCGTNLSMVSLADEAERWLHKPVIAINAATWWMALRDNGIDDKVHGAGSLLREH